MLEKQIKYAELILKTCLKVKRNQPLLINGPSEAHEFIAIVVDQACQMGVTDIGLYITDMHIKHSMLKHIPVEKLKNHPYFDKSIYNEYAKKNAAILSLSSENPDLMSDIDPEKITHLRIHTSNTTKYFEKCRNRNELAWCIAMVPTQEWADKVYEGVDDNLNKLWETIFEICHINEKNPETSIQNLVEKNEQIAEYLNSLRIKELHYQNEVGTDLTVGLSEKSRWATGVTHLVNGKDIIVNFPSLEVFTTPDKYTANGIVYSTMPLLNSGVIIEDFSLELKNGEIINVKAKKNEAMLKDLIKSMPNANYLGELALVPYDSAIRNQETLFYTTLLDENASCHIAFGSGFTECFEGSSSASDEEKESMHYNNSQTHVDFMIGSKDLNITAKTFDGKEIPIFKDGNFSKEFLAKIQNP